jgi:hypothetical protein
MTPLTPRPCGPQVTLLHAAEVAEQWRQGLDYIEHMVRTQLVAAVGKEVGPKELGYSLSRKGLAGLL